MEGTTETRLRHFLDEMGRQLNGQAYNIDVQVYTTNQYIPVTHNCFAFMFTNIGDTTASVKGMVIFPSATPTTAIGDSRTISGHKLDLYKGTMDLSFRTPVGTAPAVEVVQLFYIKE
ncbi:MAG TPA: hypothetical protein VLD19_18350 [Chitinophagaceae bacterium]|nr:hypothetical protein [Chitinophagaceae bacterium]